MKDSRAIPISLQIVAALSLIYGIGTVISMIIKLASGQISIDMGVLGIPVYFGLRRFSPGWRTFTLVCIWVGLIMCPILFIAGLFPQTPATFKVFGYRISHIPPIWLSIFSLPMFFFQLWQYRVLTNPQIRSLFFPTPHMINHRA